MNLLEQIKQLKLVPVIKLDSAADASPLAQALIEGGLPVAEVTFRTDAAEEAIRSISRSFPGMLVGAGSIICVEQVKRALDAGASFLVSAGFQKQVAAYAAGKQIPYFPGVCTPTEILMLLEYDLPVAKFFPAEQYGGLNTIKALSAPFPNLKFMPTGGINTKNVLEYLSYDKVIACGGSWMVKSDLINRHDFAAITNLTREAVRLISGEV